jgi:predicted secreted Zn-dependent protease
MALCLAAAPAMAGMTVTSDIRYYHVGGSTAESLARSMRDNPIEGDHGAAVANVRPQYRLDIDARQVGQVCRVTDVDLDIRFLTTLPQADEGGMSPRARAYWRGFVAFAARHEGTHKAIYQQCARAFVIRARRLADRTGCGSIQAEARRLFEASKQACETRQAAFDRREAPRLRRLPLFATTRR